MLDADKLAMTSMTSAFTVDDWADIASKATTFWDGHPGTGATAGVSGGPAAEQINAWLDDWTTTVAQGNESVFRRRLSFDEVTTDGARALLARRVRAAELPRWATLLDEVLTAGSRAPDAGGAESGPAPLRFLEKGAPVPFENALVPFVLTARERLIGATSGRYRQLSNGAGSQFERDLLKLLAELSGRVLLVEFRTFAAAAQLRRRPAVTSESTAQSNYEGFVSELLAGGSAALFTRYPALARLLGTAILNWVDAVAEFLDRFERDAAMLGATFFPNESALRIADVRPGLSDRHHGGRTVIAVSFASGSRLIYKPKPLALDDAYAGFIAELAQQGAPTVLKAQRTLDRGAYGWQEYVGPQPCRSEDDGRDFYRRLGGFLCLAYAFGGIDFHFENIVACGAFPVPVDLETLFHPDIVTTGDDDPVAARLRQSVLRPDILPNPISLHGQYHDISAIGPHRPDGVEVLRWTNVNTDRMSLTRADAPARSADHLPTLAGRQLDPHSNLAEIADGFRGTYRHLMAHRDALRRPEGSLRRMFACQGRFIFRPTSFYQSLFNGALHPDRLRHGADFGIHLDMLSRKLLDPAQPRAAWPLVRDEARALRDGDIPKFASWGDAATLGLNSGAHLENFFSRSPWSVVSATLDGLDEADLAFQLKLIGAAMDADAMRENVAPPAQPAHAERSGDRGAAAESLPPEVLRMHAAELGRQIQDVGVEGPGGEPGWLVLNYVPEARRFALQPIGLDLYNGRCGLALFFAALERSLPGEGFGALSVSTLAPVRRWLDRAGAAEIRSLGIGGFTGLAGMIYALTRIATLTGDSSLAAEAVRTARLITADQIDADTRLDVTGGAAGAILALLTLHRLTGAPVALEAAARCGHHLLATRTEAGSGAHGWATSSGRHLTGFAHGAAGFALALLELAARTGEQRFFTAAEQAITFENTDFVPQAGNWPDRRAVTSGRDGPEFKLAWCSGSPGIALARAAGRRWSNSASLSRHLAAAIAATRSAPLLARDHLCCGNLGLTETLLTAAQALNDGELQSAATSLASEVIDRARREGQFRVSSQTGFFNPTLLQGAAGVGYQLLRLADPDAIPCLLLLA